MYEKLFSRSTLFVVALAVVFMTGAYAGNLHASNSTEAGSEEDPLVTRSFVEENFARKGEVDYDFDIPESTTFQVVDVKPGQFLEGKEGTEIILRAGNAKIVSKTFPDGTVNGLADLSTGEDLTSGAVPSNHLLLVPRSDGRGVMAESYAYDVIFLVKGDYEIKDSR